MERSDSFRNSNPSSSSSDRSTEIEKSVGKSADEMAKHREADSTAGISKITMRGTQTPLTLVGVAMQKYNEEERKSKTENHKVLDNQKTEISLALNPPSGSLPQPSISSGIGPSATFSQFRVEAVTVKFSHEAATQATPPHPSLISTKSATSTPVDLLQIATSVSSNRSGPKSEILTVTTDYCNRTPDAGSLMLDVVDQDLPIRYVNIEPVPPSTIAATNSSSQRSPAGLPSQLAMLPPSINSQGSLLNFQPRRRGDRWSWRNCFGRNMPRSEEIDSHPYSIGPPPTYSGIFRESSSSYNESRFPLPPRLSNDTTASFAPPIPPPSYAQAQGLCVSPYSVEQIISVTPNRGAWSSRPTPTICPRCATVVVTATETRRSAITHVSALILFLCGCWPCCLVPYCIDSCKSTHHYCPICRTYLGTYTPW